MDLLFLLTFLGILAFSWYFKLTWAKSTAQANQKAKDARTEKDILAAYICRYSIRLGECTIFMTKEKIWCEYGSKDLFSFSPSDVQQVNYSSLTMQFITKNGTYTTTGLTLPYKANLAASLLQAQVSNSNAKDEYKKVLESLKIPIKAKFVPEINFILRLATITVLPILAIGFTILRRR